MRAATGTLATFLASRPASLWSADLFTFTLSGGTVLRWTTADIDVTYGGNTWLASGPILKRSAWGGKNTIEVPQLDITLASNGTDYAGGNIKLAIHNGLFDDAGVELDRAMGPTPGTVAGTTLLFAGKVGEIQLGAVEAAITCKGANIALQQMMPKNQYKQGCIHALYDAGCTMLRSNFTATNTVSSGSTRWRLYQPSNWLHGVSVVPGSVLVNGVLSFTTGAVVGEKRSVKSGTSGIAGGYLDLAYPLYVLPALGDHLACTFGCDKTQATCNGTFANLANYRGFDFIPPPETAY